MKTSFAAWTSRDSPNTLTLRSADGVIAVSLQRTRNGVFVQRALQRHGTARVVQAATFNTSDDFRRWCAADAARFDYPLLSAKLARHADELFNRHDAMPNAG